MVELYIGTFIQHVLIFSHVPGIVADNKDKMEGSHSLVLKYREGSVVVDMGTEFQSNSKESPQPSLEDPNRQSYFRENE